MHSAETEFYTNILNGGTIICQANVGFVEQVAADVNLRHGISLLFHDRRTDRKSPYDPERPANSSFCDSAKSGSAGNSCTK